MVSLFSSNFIPLAGVRCVILLTHRAISQSPSTTSQISRETLTAPVCLALCLLGQVFVHTSDFPHEDLDKALLTSLSAAFGATTVMPMRRRGENFCVPCELRWRFGFAPSSVPVHTQRPVPTGLCDGLLPLDADVAARVAAYNSALLQRGVTPCVVELVSSTDPTLLHDCSTKISSTSLTGSLPSRGLQSFTASLADLSSTVQVHTWMT